LAGSPSTATPTAFSPRRHRRRASTAVAASSHVVSRNGRLFDPDTLKPTQAKARALNEAGHPNIHACGDCGADFRGETLLRRHRVGRGAKRRCLTTLEMTGKGWRQDAEGRWRDPRNNAQLHRYRSRKAGSAAKKEPGRTPVIWSAPVSEIDLQPGFGHSLVPLPDLRTRSREERRQQRRAERGAAAVFYGPCARCNDHWTRKVSETEPGICRFCIGAVKDKLEPSS